MSGVVCAFVETVGRAGAASRSAAALTCAFASESRTVDRPACGFPAIDTARDSARAEAQTCSARTDEGLVAAEQIRSAHPQTAVLVLSHYLDSRYATRLIEQHPSGVGYLLKERVSDLALLTDALARVHEGECVIDPTIVARLLHRTQPPSQLNQLTDRERELLALIAEGRSNKGICDRLYLSPKTVEGHVKHISQKLDINEFPDDHRRVLAVITYLRSGGR